MAKIDWYSNFKVLPCVRYLRTIGKLNGSDFDIGNDVNGNHGIMSEGIISIIIISIGIISLRDITEGMVSQGATS